LSKLEKQNQAKYFGLKSHTQLSPMMEKCALLISANESDQRAEEDLEELSGLKFSHSTLQRLVNRQEFELPTSKQGVQEITLYHFFKDVIEIKNVKSKTIR
jgi:hypothetical protein